MKTVSPGDLAAVSAGGKWHFAIVKDMKGDHVVSVKLAHVAHVSAGLWDDMKFISAEEAAIKEFWKDWTKLLTKKEVPPLDSIEAARDLLIPYMKESFITIAGDAAYVRKHCIAPVGDNQLHVVLVIGDVPWKEITVEVPESGVDPITLYSLLRLCVCEGTKVIVH